MTSLALVDDHVLFREGLRAVLAGYPDLSVVAEASSAQEAQEAVLAFNPDVIVLDLVLKGADGVTLARELLRKDDTRRILVVSGYTNEDKVAEAFAAGVLGFAVKDQTSIEIVGAIRAVARFEAYLSPRISRFVVSDYLRMKRGDPATRSPLDALSPRERDVLALLLRGYANGPISRELSISMRTVETHRSRILQKLKVHSLLDLFRFAVRHHLVTD